MLTCHQYHDPKLPGNERENAIENWPIQRSKKDPWIIWTDHWHQTCFKVLPPAEADPIWKKYVSNGVQLRQGARKGKRLVQPPTFWIDFQRTCYFQGGLLVCVDFVLFTEIQMVPESRRTFYQTPMPCFSRRHDSWHCLIASWFTGASQALNHQKKFQVPRMRVLLTVNLS